MGRTDAQTSDMLIPSREWGVMPTVQDRDCCQAGACRPGGYPEQAFLYFCWYQPGSPTLVNIWAKRNRNTIAGNPTLLCLGACEGRWEG